MNIQPFVLGIGYTNSYIVYSKNNQDALIIDAPNGTEALRTFVSDHSLNVVAILLTHGHYDHVLGLAELTKAYPEALVYLDKNDDCFLEDGGKANISLLKTSPLLEEFKDNFSNLPRAWNNYEDEVFGFEVIRTPGHTLGSLCLYNKENKVLFSGDTLFRSGIGRTDLGGDYSLMLKSLDKLKTLDPDTTVLPGHGEFTTIKDEIKYNPYL